MLDLEKIDELEEKSTPAYDKGLKLNDLGWLLDHHKAKEADRRQMVEDMHLKPGDVVLDLGCGPGLWSELLAEKVWPHGRVVGVDFSPGYVAYATGNLEHRLYREIISYKEGCFTDIPFDDNTFDVIFFGNTFMYVQDPGQVIREQQRVLKPGGRVVAKDFDGAVFVLHPADPDLCLRVVTAAAHALRHNPPTPFFDNFFGRRLQGLFDASGFADIATRSYAIQKTAPLNPETRRYITKNAMWYLDTGRSYLAGEDIDRWEAYFDETSAHCIFDARGFYYCMLEVITRGTVPGK